MAAQLARLAEVNIVYVVTRSDAVGGASIHVRDLARWMLSQGHHVMVLTGGEGPVTELFRSSAVPFTSLPYLARPIHPLRDRRAYFDLKAALGGLRPDLVSTHTAKGGWLGRLACRRLGVPALYTPHGLVIGTRLSRAEGWLYTHAERVAAEWAAAIVCVSDYERQLAVRKRICDSGKLHVIHNGVADVEPELRANPGREGCLRFVSVARFEAPKDHGTLLRAFAQAASCPGPEVELILVGDGPGMLAARRLASELGIAKWVRFAGYEADPGRILAGAHGFVLSSRSEGFPRSILEAMRAGLPVIASDVGGVCEAVAHGTSGLLVPPGSMADLASALASLRLDPERRVRMGLAGRQRYDEQFRFERMAGRTAALYADVLGRDRQIGK
jgi:glycosyltransferase involved in cell wall biosynthesis